MGIKPTPEEMVDSAPFVERTGNFLKPFRELGSIRNTGLGEDEAREITLAKYQERIGRTWDGIGEALLAGYLEDVTDEARPIADAFSAATGLPVGRRTRYLDVLNHKRAEALIKIVAGEDSSFDVCSSASPLHDFVLLDSNAEETEGKIELADRFRQRIATIAHEGFHSRELPIETAIIVDDDKGPELVVRRIGTMEFFEDFFDDDCLAINGIEETTATLYSERFAFDSLGLSPRGRSKKPFVFEGRAWFGKYGNKRFRLAIPDELVCEDTDGNEHLGLNDDYTLAAAATKLLFKHVPDAEEALFDCAREPTIERKARLGEIVSDFSEPVWRMMDNSVYMGNYLAYEVTRALGEED